MVQPKSIGAKATGISQTIDVWNASVFSMCKITKDPEEEAPLSLPTLILNKGLEKVSNEIFTLDVGQERWFL